MLEEEGDQSQSDNDDDDPSPPAKRIRTRNTIDIDDDEANIANDLRTFTSRLPSQTNHIDEENGSQEGDEDRAANEHSDQGDADRDADMGMAFGDDNAEFGGEEFGDNGVCGSLFT